MVMRLYNLIYWDGFTLCRGISVEIIIGKRSVLREYAYLDPPGNLCLHSVILYLPLSFVTKRKLQRKVLPRINSLADAMSSRCSLLYYATYEQISWVYRACSARSNRILDSLVWLRHGIYGWLHSGSEKVFYRIGLHALRLNGMISRRRRIAMRLYNPICWGGFTL